MTCGSGVLCCAQRRHPYFACVTRAPQDLHADDVDDARAGLKLVAAAVAADPTNPNMRNTLATGMLWLSRKLTQALDDPRSDTEWQELLVAADAEYQRAVQLDPKSARLITNIGEVALETARLRSALLGEDPRDDAERALAAYEHALSFAPTHVAALKGKASALHVLSRFTDSAAAYEAGAAAASDRDQEAEFLAQAGAELYEAQQYDKAMSIMRRGEQLATPGSKALAQVISNIGSTMQRLGRFDEAVDAYNRVLEIDPDSAGTLNNLGAVMVLRGNLGEAKAVLERAIALSPRFSQPLTNLADLLIETSIPGDAELSQEMFQRAMRVDPRRARSIELCSALSLSPPIMESNAAIDRQRLNMAEKLERLASTPVMDDDADVEACQHVPFYTVYHGRPDRPLQELQASAFLHLLPSLRYTAPHLRAGASATSDWDGGLGLRDGSRRVRVGFVSKFFTLNHAHGLLLRGVVAGLPREYFDVTLCAITNPKEVLAPDILAAADRVVEVPMVLELAYEVLSELHLDVIVFADMLSEPISYKLGFARLAPVQCLFWGNPVTSGHFDSIDYFISGELLEPKHGTDMYTEQVVRLTGQGIWYDPADVSPLAPTAQQYVTRESLGLQEDWLLYGCLQSVFKLHPDFDAALAAILRAVPNGHVVFVEGRQRTWTEAIERRWRRSIGEVLMQRIHWVPRQNGHFPFMQLVRLMDVMLQPYPFGGSKTSADSLAAAVPIVALRGAALKGRMAAAYYDSMMMSDCCVATTPFEFVHLAARLGVDEAFRRNVSTRIRNSLAPSRAAGLEGRDWQTKGPWAPNRDIFARWDVLFDWQLLLLTATGYDITARTRVRAALRSLQRGATQIPANFDSDVAEAAAVGVGLSGEADGKVVQPLSVEQNAAVLSVDDSSVDFVASLRDAAAAHERARASFSSGLPDVAASEVRGGLRVLCEAGALPPALTSIVVGVIDGSGVARRPEVEQLAEHAAMLARGTAVAGALEVAVKLLIDLGAVLFSTWELADAREALHVALLLEPTRVAAHVNYGVVVTEAGDIESAIKHYNEALSIDPNAGGAMYNLMRALQLRDRHEDAISAYCKFLRVPRHTVAYYVALALTTPVEADNASAGLVGDDLALRAFADQLEIEGVIASDESRALQETVTRLREHDDESGVVVISLSESGVFDEAGSVLRRLASAREAATLARLGRPGSAPLAEWSDADIVGEFGAAWEPAELREGVHVISQYYIASDKPERQRELVRCLRTNLDLDSVATVLVLTEESLDLAAEISGGKWPGDPLASDQVVERRARKLRQLVIGRRMTYEIAIALAHSHLQGKIVAIANADIEFEQQSLRRLLMREHLGGERTVLHSGTVLALLRWEEDDNGVGTSRRLLLRVDQQDSWIFRSPLPFDVPDFSEFIGLRGSAVRHTADSPLRFPLGVPRCDNRIIHVLRSLGCDVRNPALDVVTIHVHSDQARPYTRRDVVPGDVDVVTIDERL